MGKSSLSSFKIVRAQRYRRLIEGQIMQTPDRFDLHPVVISGIGQEYMSTIEGHSISDGLI